MARGSVTRRSDGWCIRLDVGVDPGTGKRRQVSRQGFRTKREAQAVLNDLLLERELVRRPEASVFGPTVGEYLEEWLARARVSVRESTWAAYRNAVGHLVDGLGGGSLRLLSALEVERFEQQLLASGRARRPRRWRTFTPCCTERSHTRCATGSSIATWRHSCRHRVPSGPK